MLCFIAGRDAILLIDLCLFGIILIQRKRLLALRLRRLNRLYGCFLPRQCLFSQRAGIVDRRLRAIYRRLRCGNLSLSL